MYVSLYLFLIAYLFNFYKFYMDFLIFIIYLYLFIFFVPFLLGFSYSYLSFKRTSFGLVFFFELFSICLNFNLFLFILPPHLFFSFLLSFYITSYYVYIHDFYQPCSSLLICIVKF